MNRTIVSVVFALAALLAACSSNDKKDLTPSPPSFGGAPSAASSPVVSTTASAAANKWDKTTIFAYGPGAPTDFWQQACAKTPSSLSESNPCILPALKAANASDSAVAFFQKQKYFLVMFEEHGRVDYGQGGAPWFNMGRPTPIYFLNGSPDVIEANIPKDYLTNPTYAEVLKPPPTLVTGNIFTPPPATPWSEYGQLTAATSSATGQQFVVSYPLRDCRACADRGYIPIAYNFDTQGKQTTTETLAFKPK